MNHRQLILKLNILLEFTKMNMQFYY